MENVLDAAELLKESGIDATVLRLTAVAPLPVQEIAQRLSENHHVVIIEETCGGSGIRAALGGVLLHCMIDCKADGIVLGDRFITHGNLKTLYAECGLDAQSIANYVQEVLNVEN